MASPVLETADRTEHLYPPEDAEARRALVKRIVASAAFARSNRLSDFLKYVYALAEKGRFDEIHEQNIGSTVFGRTRDYDPGVDSIVRSHASRLRHRLKEYFEQEGQNEPLLLTMPRGSYIPVFTHRPVEEPASTTSLTAVAPEGQTRAADETQELQSAPTEFSPPAQSADAASRTIARLRIALAAAALLIVALGSLLYLRPTLAAASHIDDAAVRHPLWKVFAADSGSKTVVVSSDSGLVMYQHLTGNAVSLPSYISGDYLKHTGSPKAPEEIVRKFGTRRYTPALDLSVLDRMTRLFGERHDLLSFRYARDLRLDDLKQGNAILLGTAESNPWVQLFEPSMNFAFQDDLLHDKAQMVNRHPLAGESLHYDSTPQDATPTIYGVVAYRPNLQSTGSVLILEGQTMAGTQTAADFIFDDSYFLPFAKSIAKPDGSIPYFEVLLRSNSLGGQSSQIEVVAVRKEAR